MATPKRKRTPTKDTSSKRPRYTQPVTSSLDSQEEWEALRILAQSGQGFGLRYLVDWSGIDPATGKQWEPTWVKATAASESLRAAWREEQSTLAQEESRARSTSQPRPESQPRRSRGRPRKHIVASPESSSSAFQVESSAKTGQSEAAAISSSSTASYISVLRPDGTSPQIAVDSRGDSFNRGEYELHLEIPESQPSSESRTADTDLESSQLFASQPPFRASGIVPDTQNSAEDASYIPVTQEELESSVYSSSAEESDEHLIGYSGLLNRDGPATLDARAQSPATSIAETVAEIPQDSYSERQLESQQEEPEISETLVTPLPTIGTDFTSAQKTFSGEKQSDTIPTDLHSRENQQESESHAALVESAPQSPTQGLQQPIGDIAEITVQFEEEVEPADNATRPALSSTKLELQSELLVVADTPQISQVATSVQESSTQREPQHSALYSEPLSTGSREHNAQFIFSSAFADTERITTESVSATLVSDLIAARRSKHSGSISRHDSSQEFPERLSQSAVNSSSPVPHPPSYSLRTLDSNVPARPATPILNSSSSRMAGDTTESAGDLAERRLRESQALRNANNPYVPRKLTRLSQAPLGPGRPPVPPAINVSAEGTRSPSTVPDRSPAPPVQTSLRTVAFANAKDNATESLLNNPLAATCSNTNAGPTQEKADLVAARPDDNDHDVVSDDDDENEYHEELHLEREEYIVPLYIDGRQKNSYIEYIERKTDLLNAVLESEGDLASDMIDGAEQVLTHLRNLETHPDLTYAEAESATTNPDSRSRADVQHGARFGIDNSVKFRFLGELFDQLREHSMHVVLLLDQADTALINILRTFLEAAAHNYHMPLEGYTSNVSDDTLRITVIPRTPSLLLQRADLAICLNGVQSASNIRQNDWARESGNIMPVLHLVIPRTIGHIERYFPPNVSESHRIVEILTALGQLEESGEIGNQIDIDTPDAVEAATLVASWLTSGDGQASTEWPLPSIGSSSEFLDFGATQQSTRSTASSPVPERTKRPLETDDSDTAKRIRYTPLAHVDSQSGGGRETEITHVSDSMPGSRAMEKSHLATSLERIKSELLQERRERREEQVMWNRQQTEHENRQQQYRKLFNEKTEVERSRESVTKDCDRVRSQLVAQANEMRTLREELDAQRNLSLASDNDKDVEVTRLRKELEAITAERNKLANKVKSNDDTLEYTKEGYREASNKAGQLQTKNTALEKENEKLKRQVSGDSVKLKRMHLDKSAENIRLQYANLQEEHNVVKALLRQKEEELIRAKNNSGRSAYGTRGQSTTPQPKTRSRAASPTRPPRGGGRISNLVAEER
ncbi:hypothetical protein C7974DRAFT_448460 [Boeremia exigua]|uniref:uncharacterized protein n=1 Tax=Boeremia exigua TaxID=749465 RepID=UPI001E8EC87E|nr:uncharacterized protein C7974DRAFT_448460 [Boeremia exigua]KAH6638767.1 hypothetical protein C7974DRAFT_448460 [Boeremia exigua]